MPDTATPYRRRRAAGGRPKLPPEARRCHEMRFYLNPAELADLDQKAAICKLSPQTRGFAGVRPCIGFSEGRGGHRNDR